MPVVYLTLQNQLKLVYCSLLQSNITVNLISAPDQPGNKFARDHSYTTSAKALGGWVQKKWQFLLTFRTINANVGWVDGSEKSKIVLTYGDGPLTNVPLH